MTKAPPKNRGRDQRARFIEAARKLGCDESEAAFDKKLAKIAKPKPASKAPKK